MNPDEASAKDKIFQAAMELVTKGKTEQQITTREIASKAGVNLALVNYYYQSKENLLSQVVGTMMGDIIEQSNQNSQTGNDAQTKLRNMLGEWSI
jgi:AcrR family transcriptional regulator